MNRGSMLAKSVPLCPDCGRVLQEFEFCECKTGLPKDGLRACCSQFISRSSYRGKSYLDCGGRKLRFDNRKARDEFYRAYCCSSSGCRTCPAMNQPMKADRGLEEW